MYKKISSKLWLSMLLYNNTKQLWQVIHFAFLFNICKTYFFHDLLKKKMQKFAIKFSSFWNNIIVETDTWNE